MGIVKVRFKVYNPADMSRYVEVDGIVDTGVICSVIPASLLDSIGIKSLERKEVLGLRWLRWEGRWWCDY